ncbi:hypothetical protein [Leptospira ilyithenensis]|uniref:hypothetical protein n=1 Tax=Leptospira ilyithenensis TaxID=2484901 RepID=UPI001FECD77F|nr:hypothetical protein [Leptospira ilyithenensis]
MILSRLSELLPELYSAFGQTFLMLFIYIFFGTLANLIRLIPYVILLVSLLPLTLLLTGTTIGPGCGVRFLIGSSHSLSREASGVFTS